MLVTLVACDGGLHPRRKRTDADAVARRKALLAPWSLVIHLAIREQSTPANPRSVCVLACLSAEHGERHYLDIEPERVATNVLEVVHYAVDHLVQRIRLTPKSVHLGPAGDSRLHLVTEHVLEDPRAILHVVRDRVRARPDHGHVARKDVEELRQLIDRGATKKCPEAGHPWVVTSGLLHLVMVFEDPHGSKFPDLDLLPIAAVATLLEESRPARVQPDAYGDGGKKRPSPCEKGGGERDVEEALRQAVDAPGSVHDEVGDVLLPER